MDEFKEESEKNFITSDYDQLENKLTLLYLVDKMDIPMSDAQISHFATEGNYMDYFTLQQSLAELTQVGYLDKTQDNNNIRYTVTEEGLTALEYFETRIPIPLRNSISKYVSENQKRVKKDFEITANYFYDIDSNEFTVKCALYEDKSMLMEINLSVVTREQAKNICNNWKSGVNILYGNILSELSASIDFDTENNN